MIDQDICLGCGMPVNYETGEKVWLNTALGITCTRTHPGCEDRAAANHREQPAKRIDPPETKVEKRKRKATPQLKS